MYGSRAPPRAVVVAHVHPQEQWATPPHTMLPAYLVATYKEICTNTIYNDTKIKKIIVLNEVDSYHRISLQTVDHKMSNKLYDYVSLQLNKAKFDS